MLSRLLAAALLAGLFAGLVTSGLQALVTTPLILRAETFEQAQPAHAAGGAAAHAHDDAEGWKPADGAQRALVTSLATIVTAVGYALLLGAAMLAAGSGFESGATLRWALGGFMATGLAPALGLTPELPGMGGGDVVARQLWWIGTAAATAAGLWLAGLGLTGLGLARPGSARLGSAGLGPGATPRSVLFSIAGLALLAAPHMVGAPHGAEAASSVPAALAARFAASSLAMSFLLWAAIGVGLGLAWARLSQRAVPAAQRA